MLYLSIYTLSAFPDTNRPKPAERSFVSKAIDDEIDRVKPLIKDQYLAWMFENCFPNTIDTTVQFTDSENPDTFVITGDINAMWLRDSSAQVFPYLPFMKNDEHLTKMIKGVINRQIQQIIIDPYANAFLPSPGRSEWFSDNTQMKAQLHERKFEIDSLAYPVRLMFTYWKHTSDTSLFDGQFTRAMKLILKTFKEQQRIYNKSSYYFQRSSSLPTETLINQGEGNPVARVGLICSGFRPSDDAALMSYNIPANMFAVLTLRRIAEIFVSLETELELATECTEMANLLDDLIRKYGVVEHEKYGKIYVYELDGTGSVNLMDDANVPSLLAAPYLGYISNLDPIYQNTRRFVWSESNPYFYRGPFGEGVSSPHVDLNYTWPMSSIMRGLTSYDPDEILSVLHMLKTTDAKTGFIHESFNVFAPEKFTRKWFAWANTIFGEFVLKVLSEHPHLMEINDI